MTTLLHQLRKDVRRHSRWLLVWAVVCVLPLGTLVVPSDATMAHAALASLAPLLRFAVFVVLTVLVVHEDSLVGTTAFWLTRPIGWRALFESKLLFVIGLLVLPLIAVDLAQMASTGVGLPYVVLALPEIGLDWVVWGLGVLALATLGTTLPGFLGTLLQVALLWVAASWIVVVARAIAAGASLRDATWSQIAFAFMPMFEPGDDPWHVAPSWLASRALASFVLIAVAALVVAAIQYKTRRRRLTWAALGLSVLAIVALRDVWRWDFLGLPPLRSSTPVRATADVRVSLDPNGRLESSAAMSYPGAVNRRTLYGSVRVGGVDPPLAGEIDGLDGWIKFDDGSKLPLAGRSWDFTSRWDPRAVETLLDGARFVNLEQEAAGRTPLLSLDARDYAGHAGSSGRVAGTALLAVREYRVVATLPLRPGAAYDHGVEHAVVTGVQNTGGDCTVLIRETHVSLLLAPNAHAYRRMFVAQINPDVVYVLRNRARGEAFWPEHGVTVGFGWPSRTRIEEISGIATYRSNIASDPPLPHIDDAWLADADLLRIEGDARQAISSPIENTVFHVPTDDEARARP